MPLLLVGTAGKLLHLGSRGLLHYDQTLLLGLKVFGVVLLDVLLKLQEVLSLVQLRCEILVLVAQLHDFEPQLLDLYVDISGCLPNGLPFFISVSTLQEIDICPYGVGLGPLV